MGKELYAQYVAASHSLHGVCFQAFIATALLFFKLLLNNSSLSGQNFKTTRGVHSSVSQPKVSSGRSRQLLLLPKMQAQTHKKGP